MNTNHWPLVVFCLLMAGCRQDMHDQPRLEPLEQAQFFKDGAGSRPLVAGTVAQGHLNEDAHLYTGAVGSEPATTFPFDITEEVLRRGGERYDVFCAPCHDRTGDGGGFVVQRGFAPAASFHTDDLRAAAPGRLFSAISYGFSEMPDYAEEVPVRDRWAIVAYIRALQLSQRADVATLPQVDRDALERIR